MKKIIFHVLTGIGAICCVLVVVISVMNVIRGYSVHCFVYDIIPFVAIISLMAAECLAEKPKGIRSTLGLLVLLYTSTAPVILQGRHIKRGMHLYNTGQYQAALAEFKKEASQWYLRLQDNSRNEVAAQKQIALTYGRLCQFDKVIPVYRLIAARYPGYNAGFAAGMIKGLGEYQQWVDSTPPFDPNNLFAIASAYQMFNCPSKAIETYQKLLKSDVHPDTKKLAQEQITQLQDPNSLYNRVYQ